MTTSYAIRQLVKLGRVTEAKAAIGDLLREECGVEAVEILINDDPYSLNSVNGFVTDARHEKMFFKFHTEEGEADSIGEYYRANILARFDLAVDLPIHASTKPGKQVLLYKFRRERKLVEVCLDIERGLPTDFSAEEILAAQESLDIATFSAAERSFAAPTPQSEHTALHQLFYNRLVDEKGDGHLGGRYNTFYSGHPVFGPKFAMGWADFEHLTWTINGVRYGETLNQLFLKSLDLLEPKALAKQPVIVSHGDAHNANVWVQKTDGAPKLVMFDPAFAGDDIPALLGEIKATFHNIFAHPFWLYTPEIADEAFSVEAKIANGGIAVCHDWKLSPLREGFLRSKVKHYWLPLLGKLKAEGMLPENWEEIMRVALFCCPTLVMSLLASSQPPVRTPKISLLGFAVAVAAGSKPVEGEDFVSEMFAELRRGLVKK